MTKQPDEPLEAKTAIMRTFEQMGGLSKMVQWAKTHQKDFYTQLFVKLLPMQVHATATVNIKDDPEQLRAQFTNALQRLIDARRREEQRTGLYNLDGVTYRKAADGSFIPTDERLASEGMVVIIDNDDPAPTNPADTLKRPSSTFEPPPPRSTPRLVTPETTAEVKRPPPADALTPEQARQRAMAPASPTPLNHGEPSTTDKFLSWSNAGGWGRRRSDWGPV
jgi:hypothetical protein